MKRSKSLAGGKSGRRMKHAAMFILAMVAVLLACVIPELSFGPEAFLAVAPLGFIAKKAKEAGVDLTEGEQKLMDIIEKSFTEFASGKIDEAELDARILKAKDGLKEELGSKMSEIDETVKAINKEVKKMRENGVIMSEGSVLEKAVDALLDHPKMVEFINGKSRTSGKISLKSITNLTGDYTGNILISQQSKRVSNETQERRLNMRDVIMVDKGDPQYPSVTYAEIYELNRNAAAVSENGRLPQSAFKIREVTDETRRIGTYAIVSKRLLKSRIYLRSYLINRIPKWVRMSEDAQILFGDGNGENLKGIAKRSLNIVEWLTGNIVTGVAGDVANVESYDTGAKTMISFSKPFSKIEEGQLITFPTAPTSSALLTPKMLHKYNDNVIILDVPFVALSQAQINALTFNVKNNFYNTVADPDLGDAISAIFAILTYGEYTPNVIALNPSTVFELSTLKDTTGRRLDLVVNDGGIKRVAGTGTPIVETTAIPPGYFFCGDLLNGASLVDYTELEIEFVEDVETKLSNSVAIIAQEEVILQVFNRFACAYGNLDDVLNAIKK